MMLLVGSGVLAIIGVVGLTLMRCPKCSGLLGRAVSSKEKYCRYCGADFDAEA